MTARTSYRLATAVAIATVLFLVLAIGALGIVGEGGRPDRVFAAVPVVLAVGAAVARFRARGMALALLATALTQVFVTGIALIVWHDTEGASIVDILGINAMYAALFGLAALLFRRSAEQQSALPTSSRS